MTAEPNHMTVERFAAFPAVQEAVAGLSHEDLIYVMYEATAAILAARRRAPKPIPVWLLPRPEDQGWAQGKLLGQSVLSAWRAWDHMQDETPPNEQMREHCIVLAKKLQGYGEAIEAMMDGRASEFTDADLHRWAAEDEL